MPVTTTEIRNYSATQFPNNTTQEISASDLRGIISLLADFLDAFAMNSGKLFTSRAQAVAAGQASLPPTNVGILVVEAGRLVIRTPMSSTDALFSTAPAWGIFYSLDLPGEISNRIANTRDAGLIPLTTPATGTPNNPIVSIPTAILNTGVGMGPSAVYELIPSANNTGPVILTITGYGDFPLLDGRGRALTADALRMGRSQIIRRRGQVFRFGAGAVDERSLQDAIAAAQGSLAPNEFLSLAERAEAAAAIAQTAVQLNYPTFQALMDETSFYAAGSIATVRETGERFKLLLAPQQGRHYTNAASQGVMVLGGEVHVADGQSNIRSSNIASVGGDLSADPRIRIWTGTAWVTWDIAAGIGGWGGATGRNSILFQAAKQARRRGVPAVYCVLNGFPGNTLDQWVNDGPGDTDVVGSNLTTAINQVNSAMVSPELATAGISTVSGLIWGQGEGDGGPSFNLDRHARKFAVIKSTWRDQPWFPRGTPITLLSMPPQPSSRVVDGFIKSYVPYDGDPYTSFTDNTDQPAPAGNLMHWPGDAMNEIGARAYEKLRKGGDSESSPAEIVSALWRMRGNAGTGVGLGINYDEATGRVLIGSASYASGTSLVHPFFAFRMTDEASNLQLARPTACLLGFTLKSYTGANFAAIGHPVNTDPQKQAGTAYWESVTRHLMISTGSGPAAEWARIAASSFVTPS